MSDSYVYNVPWAAKEKVCHAKGVWLHIYGSEFTPTTTAYTVLFVFKVSILCHVNHRILTRC